MVLNEFLSFQKYRENLFCIDFTTVNEYITQLQSISTAVGEYKHNAMFYLAAAVSDFYIPEDMMHEHKIQSSTASTGLTLQLEQVPKMLKTLVNEWAPDSYIVSFKLETDMDLVIPKASNAIENYGVHLVVANLLQVLYCTVLYIDYEYQVLTYSAIKKNYHMLYSMYIYSMYIYMISIHCHIPSCGVQCKKNSIKLIKGLKHIYLQHKYIYVNNSVTIHAYNHTFILQTRHDEVHLVHRNTFSGDTEVFTILRLDGNDHIESQLVCEIVSRHKVFASNAN